MSDEAKKPSNKKQRKGGRTAAVRWRRRRKAKQRALEALFGAEATR